MLVFLQNTLNTVTENSSITMHFTDSSPYNCCRFLKYWQEHHLWIRFVWNRYRKWTYLLELLPVYTNAHHFCSHSYTNFHRFRPAMAQFPSENPDTSCTSSKPNRILWRQAGTQPQFLSSRQVPSTPESPSLQASPWSAVSLPPRPLHLKEGLPFLRPIFGFVGPWRIAMRCGDCCRCYFVLKWVGWSGGQGDGAGIVSASGSGRPLWYASVGASALGYVSYRFGPSQTGKIITPPIYSLYLNKIALIFTTPPSSNWIITLQSIINFH